MAALQQGRVIKSIKKKEAAGKITLSGYSQSQPAIVPSAEKEQSGVSMQVYDCRSTTQLYGHDNTHVWAAPSLGHGEGLEDLLSQLSFYKKGKPNRNIKPHSWDKWTSKWAYVRALSGKSSSIVSLFYDSVCVFKKCNYGDRQSHDMMNIKS